MKVKGTKGRKPKPYSKGGRRLAVAKTARRAATGDRAEQSRGEAKRAAAKKAAARQAAKDPAAGRAASDGARVADRTGGRTGGRTGAPAPKRPMRPIENDEPDWAADSSAASLPDLAIPVRRVAGQTQRTARITTPAPLLAIVGRPNVGKSTLFNRLTSSRRSIVGDEPGITRDRIYGETEWSGHVARVVDTGGVLPDDPDLIPAEIFRQAQVALHEAQAIVMVVDGRTPLASPDYDLARLLFQSGKPLVLAVNKMDSAQLASHISEYRRLGIQEVVPVSSEHGIGIGDLLDHLFSVLPFPEPSAASSPEAGPGEDVEEPEDGNARKHRTHGEHAQAETSIAIIGRPNVGKSTLLNVLTGSQRAIVSPIAGTTRDAVDEVIDYQGSALRFVDTAGIRRKGKTKQMAEKLSVVMARRHLEAADVALLLIDATEGVTSTDATIGGYAHESGRSVILVVNKWDLVTTKRNDGKPAADQAIYEKQVRNVLKYLSYAPIVFISAADGKNIQSLLKLVSKVAAERRKRISTGQMNRFLAQVDFERATVPAANRVRILYMTQAAVAPPTFILFTNRMVKLHFSFQRFLENQVRAAFGFLGSPIWFKVRPRNQKAEA